MGKKMNLPSLFKIPPTPNTATNTPSWPWPYCGALKTLSFRADDNPPAPCPEDSGAGGDEAVEAVIRGVRATERLFFEPGETSSILGREPKSGDDDRPDHGGGGDGPLVVAMDSMDPHADFKRSMEEMVEAHGLKESWDGLEELLCWFLQANGKPNHGYIVGAFVDLLVDLAFASSNPISSSSSISSSSCSDIEEDHDRCCSTTTTNSPLSFSFSTSCTTSHCLSSLEAEDEIEKTVDSGL
ncbi:Transcription repressor like [Actinidia chinensis var. chinensis]|uniref:Transcription repressor n=1 Tax=Actinidia chinensis var. chinensis TaxID=1590841 RepID=A0A2R6QVV0_ACTCC|nr:Transcription repressor like [Actinidia chinensis var. chinensis]